MDNILKYCSDFRDIFEVVRNDGSFLGMQWLMEMAIMLAIVVNWKTVAVQRHFLKRGELRHSSELLSQFFTLIRFKPIFLDDVTSAMQNSDEKKADTKSTNRLL